jgi:hypothetical protein
MKQATERIRVYPSTHRNLKIGAARRRMPIGAYIELIHSHFVSRPSSTNKGKSPSQPK